MSNGFWYPASFVPNKFPLDPLLCPATQLAKNQFHSDEVFYFSQFEQNVRIVKKKRLIWNWRSNVDLEKNCICCQSTSGWVSRRSGKLATNGFKSPEQRNQLEIKWKSIGLFSNASSLGWVGQINDGASRYKEGARVRKAANGHICTRPHQKCKKSTFVPDQTRNVKNLNLYQTQPEM